MLSSMEVTMAEIERLSIALPAPMADAIRRAVKDGEYASTSEVIRDALRLWESRRHLRERDVAVLRRRWDEGKASGLHGPLDIKGLIAGERAKLKGSKGRRD
jgi:antitoxin ParD1/3/4